MDLSKLRVVDLKQELQNRGLDTKGVKAILISRLQAAIDSAAEAEGSESNDAEQGSEGGGAEESILPDEESGVTHSPSPEPPAPPVVVADETSSETEVVEQMEQEVAPEAAPETMEVPVVVPEVAQEASGEPEAAQEVMEATQDVSGEPEGDQEVTQEAVDAPQEEEEKKEDDSVDPYTQNETMPMDEVEKQAEEVKVAEPEPEKDDRKRKRSRSPSSEGRRRPRRDSQSANTDDFMNIEDEPVLPENPSLSWVDSDLHVKISGGDFCEGRTMSDGVLGLMWAGARATHGVTSGRCFYEVQLLQRNSRVNFPDEKNLFDFRCGWSTLATDMLLGESKNSFAYTGDGKKCHGEAVEDFGVKFSVGDVVGVYLDLEAEPCKVQFTVNGEDQGVAFEFDKDSLNGEALFPHILTKNVTFKVNFGQLENTLLAEFKPKKRNRSEDEKQVKEEEKQEVTVTEEVAKTEEEKPEVKEGESSEEKKEEEKTEDAPEAVKEKPEEVSETTEQSQEKMETEEVTEEEPEKPINRETLPDFVFIANLPREELVEGLKRPEARKDCEVIMMIGLPASGKTHWVTKWNEENPEKRYNIIGNNYLYSRMTNRPKSTKSEKFNDMCNRSFTVLQELAQKRRRNYILDQTNVFASAQRRKMKGFGDFKRIAVIVIPDDEEYKRRVACKNEAGNKDYADYAVNEMKANFSLPTTDLGWFDEIKYGELQVEAATKLVAEYNEKGRRSLPQAVNRRPYEDYRDRRRRDYNNDRRWDRGDRRDRWQPSMGGPRGPSGWRPPPPRDYYGGGYDRRPSHDRWNSPHAWVSGGGGGGRRSNERDYRRDYGNRDYQRNRDRDSRSGRSGRDQDFRERRSDNRGGGGDNYGSRSSHSSSRSSRRDYPSSKRDSGSSSSMKSYGGSPQSGMVAGGAAMAAQGGAAWGAGWAGQHQWQMPGNWGTQGWQQSGWNAAGAQNWGGWSYGATSGVNGADWSANSWDVNQAVYATNSCPNVDTTSDQTN